MQSLRCVQMHESIMTYQSNKHPEINQSIQTCTESKSDCHPQSLQTDQTRGSHCEAICFHPPRPVYFSKELPPGSEVKVIKEDNVETLQSIYMPSWEHYISYQRTFEDDCPFPQVGYVSSLEGIYVYLGLDHISIEKFIFWKGPITLKGHTPFPLLPMH